MSGILRPCRFDRHELGRLLSQRPVATSELTERLVDAVYEVLQSRVTYGRDLPWTDFIYGVRPAGCTSVILEAAPVVLFTREAGKYTATAVLCPRDDYAGLADAHQLYTLAGIELVPIPEHLASDSTYLASSDFKKRLRRAVYAPTKVPFVPFPVTSNAQAIDAEERGPARELESGVCARS